MSRAKLNQIKAVVMDVDGVLTDGTFYWDSNELELKRFSFWDRTGIPLAQNAGIIFALMSGESTPAGIAIVERYARKVNISDIYTACRDKACAVRDFTEKHKISLSEICFMGDDVNDLPAMELVGLTAAPANAHPAVLKSVDIVTKRKGGKGAVRELLDMIIGSGF